MYYDNPRNNILSVLHLKKLIKKRERKKKRETFKIFANRNTSVIPRLHQ